MMKDIFYMECPQCKTISGFCFLNKQKENNNFFICPNCQIEYKLNKWKNSNEKKYNKQNKERGGSKFYKK